MAKRVCWREIPTELSLERFEEFILPHLTVSKTWLRQVIVALTLVCRTTRCGFPASASRVEPERSVEDTELQR